MRSGDTTEMDFFFFFQFVDQKASEPEALIAASLSEGPLLLCGDPKQFGPVLRSHRQDD